MKKLENQSKCPYDGHLMRLLERMMRILEKESRDNRGRKLLKLSKRISEN